VNNRSLRDTSANERSGLAFRIEDGRDGVASTFPNYHNNLSLAVLVPRKAEANPSYFLISRFDVAAIHLSLFAFVVDNYGNGAT
jgi:hypothetical protein